jgi:DUF4097 and DUF4098 domain-containing protein YvlB
MIALTAAPLFALALALIQGGADTLVAVPRGTRLDVGLRGGNLVVRTWSRDEVQVDGEDVDRVSVRRDEDRLRIRARDGRSTTNLEVTIPAWMAVAATGQNLDATLDGVGADVRVSTVQGDVHVRGGNGEVNVHSVSGLVSVEAARGSIRATSVNDDIIIRGAAGSISANGVNGDVSVEGAQSSDVDLESVNGDVRYAGTIQDGGRYGLSTHNGDVVLAVPEGTSAAVSVATYRGEIEASFPIQIRQTGGTGRRLAFTLGAGGARIDIESFQGVIRLVRP